MSTPASVNGRLVLPDGTPPPAGSFVQLDLKNYGTAQPTVDGVAIYNQKQYPLSTVDGTWSGTLYRNDNISCNGVFNSVWAMTYFSGGRAVYPAKLVAVSQASADLDTLAAVNIGTTPVAPTQPLTGAESALAQFPVAASTWTGVHNFGTQAVFAQFYDLSWNEILPDTAVSTDVNTFTATFLQPQAGFMVMVNVGNWTPSVTNPNYIIGNPTSSQSVTGDFPFTLGGSLAAKRIENVRYADQFAGADIGAQINAAYADLPSAGGTIYVPAGAYSFSIPIVLSTINKLVKLVGAGPTTTLLQFTASSGTAITIDCYNGNGIAAVLEDFELKTTVSGSTATGISVGPTNNGSNARLNRLYVNGFKIGVLSQTYGVAVTDCQIGPGSSAAGSIGFQTGSNNIADDNRLRGGTIQGFAVLVQNDSSNPLWLEGVQLSNATVGPWVNNSGAIHASDSHFFNQASGPASLWFTNPTGSSSSYHHCKFETNKTTGTPTSFATVSGGVLVAIDNVFLSSGETVTEVIQFSGSGQGLLAFNTVGNSTFVPTIWNKAYSPGVVDLSAPTTNTPNDNTVLGPTEIRMDGTTSGSSIFRLFDTTGSNYKHFRVNASQLQILNSAGSTILATLDDVGNWTATAAVKGTAGLVAGSGTTLARYARYTPTLSPVAVAANTTAEQSFASVLTSGDVVVGVSKPTAQAGLGIVGWRASGTTLFITFSNNTAGSITPTASEVYQVIGVQ